ncbi:alpha/beta fold hydrolase [Diaminobutyricibacter sp. McL0618]|uniref:alpha/beta fold hydrolase n=1 Tax=Leifsonia sp. McL0618 TaxID=3415677 RepID=UPI003CECA371
MPTLDVPGASLYYETAGHISSPAVLLIHAGVATLRMWDPLVDRLAIDHFVVRFDTRGFGRTTTENVEFSDRQDARDLLDHLGVMQALVIGCSRGGRIAIDLALESPERVTGLVTIGSGPSGFPVTELTDTEDALFDRCDDAYKAADWHLLSRLNVELWTIGPTRNNDDLDPRFVELAYELNLPNAEHGGEAPVAIPLEPPAFDRVVDIEVPALVTVGEFDLSEALAQQAYLLDSIPTADGYIFSDTAHLPSVEHPDEFADVLLGWMERNAQ